MCGIAGYIGNGNKEILERMIDTLKHRGPDDRGVFVRKDVGLAHSRLSILDLSPSGHQPMSNEDETVWLTFNGEIYNYLELKNSLNGKHLFKSQTDTEVIIHLYEEVGEKVFEMIHGMFALAIYDFKKEILFLGRDRMGKKPLYWMNFRQGIAFASELKALFEHPEFQKSIDLESLNKYFTYEYIPAPRTIFKKILKLEAGHYLKFNKSGLIQNDYWGLDFEPKSININDNIKSLESEISRSVKERLVADVPVGIFLSGGIDSSLIAYYTNLYSKDRIKTFSIGFRDKSFDESSYARSMADFLKSEHHERIFDPDDCLAILPEVIEKLDEPMADASILPTYLLSKFTRENVTVALGGDGGDEIFAGYDPFVAHKLASLIEKIPKILLKVVYRLVLLLPTSFNNMSFDFRLKKLISGFLVEKKYRNQVWMSAFDDKERKQLFNEKINRKIYSQNVFDDVDRHLKKSNINQFIDRVSLEFQRLYLQNQILTKIDRASMFNSLEVRSPFLDTKVVELANHLPVNQKINGLNTKHILKIIARGKIPDHIINRKKKGFGIPIAKWINDQLKPLVLEELGSKNLEKIGLFNVSYVQDLLSQHFSKKKDNRKQIWTLLVFVLWWKRWYK